MAEVVNIGLIGFGNVGQAVYELIRDNGAHIKEKTGFDLRIKRIAVRDSEKKRAADFDKNIITEDAGEIFDDPEIMVVVELIGGYEKAKDYVLKALKNGKYVVTANKLLMAKDGAELFEFAEKNNSDIYFEASVAGAIPAVLPISLSMCADKIESIHAIVNGTCNFILTRMSEGMAFPDALKLAQEKGFAESVPDLDINGTDAMQKLVILSSLSFGNRFREEDVHVEGIGGIDSNDLKYADDLGYRIKLLAIANLDADEKIELTVAPFLVSKEHQLASVNNELNAITIKGSYADELTFVGKGAGGKPTSSAVVADIINAAQDKLNCFEGIHLIKLKGERRIKIKNIGDCERRFYVRLSALDKPGVVAKFSDIFSENRINIASVIPKEDSPGNFVPVVVVLHKAKEKDVYKAISEILKLEEIESAKLLRFKDF